MNLNELLEQLKETAIYLKPCQELKLEYNPVETFNILNAEFGKCKKYEPNTYIKEYKIRYIGTGANIDRKRYIFMFKSCGLNNNRVFFGIYINLKENQVTLMWLDEEDWDLQVLSTITEPGDCLGC